MEDEQRPLFSYGLASVFSSLSDGQQATLPQRFEQRTHTQPATQCTGRCCAAKASVCFWHNLQHMVVVSAASMHAQEAGHGWRGLSP
jgi:hypothetical protein